MDIILISSNVTCSRHDTDEKFGVMQQSNTHRYYMRIETRTVRKTVYILTYHTHYELLIPFVFKLGVVVIIFKMKRGTFQLIKMPPPQKNVYVQRGSISLTTRPLCFVLNILESYRQSILLTTRPWQFLPKSL